MSNIIKLAARRTGLVDKWVEQQDRYARDMIRSLGEVCLELDDGQSYCDPQWAKSVMTYMRQVAEIVAPHEPRGEWCSIIERIAARHSEEDDGPAAS